MSHRVAHQVTVYSIKHYNFKYLLNIPIFLVDYSEKSQSAVDYSDINELADEPEVAAVAEVPKG